jgi:hypothetical protein
MNLINVNKGYIIVRGVCMTDYNLAKIFKRVEEYKVSNWFENGMLQFKLRRFGKKNFIYYTFNNIKPTKWCDVYLLDEERGILAVQYTKVI